MNLSKHFLLPILCVALPGFSFAAGPEPILDLRAAASGQLKESAGKKVDLDIDAGKVESTADGLSILDGKAVTILHDPKSPVFSRGSFTWIIKCKFNDPAAPSLSPILLGRWEVGTWKAPQDLRVAAIGLVPEKGVLNFILSPDGTAAASVGAQSPPITAGGWFQIVLRVEVGSFMAFSVFDDRGDVLFEETVREIEMKELFHSAADLVIGAGHEVGMTLARVRVWDKALSPDQVERAVSEK